MESTIQLSLEQELKLRILEDRVKHLTLQESQEYLLEVLRQSMVKDNFFKQVLKNNI
jgi:Phycobilisome degradation protein nblA